MPLLKVELGRAGQPNATSGANDVTGGRGYLLVRLYTLMIGTPSWVRT